MSNLSKIVYLNVANAINFLILFITTPFLARALPKLQNGTFNQFNSLVALLSLLFCMGLPSILNIFYTKYKGKEHMVFYSLNKIILCSALFSVFLVILFGKHIFSIYKNDLLNKYVLFLAINTAGAILINAYTITNVYAGTINKLNKYTIGLNIIKIGLLFCSIYLTANALWYMLVSITIITILHAVLAYIFLPSSIKQRATFNAMLIKEMLQLSWPLLLNILLSQGVFLFGGIILSNIKGTEEFAIFRNGAIEIPFLSTIFTTISAVVAPTLYGYYQQNNYRELLQKKAEMAVYVAAAIFPIVILLLFLSKWFILNYLGTNYQQAWIVFLLYNLVLLIRITDYQEVLTFLKKTTTILAINCGVLLYNVMSNYILVPKYGYVGAAVNYTITIYLAVVLIVWFTCKEVKLSVAYFFKYKQLAIIIILCTIAASAVYYLLHYVFQYNKLAIVVVVTIYFTIVYVALLRLRIINLLQLQPIVQKLPLSIKNILFKIAKQPLNINTYNNDF